MKSSQNASYKNPSYNKGNKEKIITLQNFGAIKNENAINLYNQRLDKSFQRGPCYSTKGLSLQERRDRAQTIDLFLYFTPSEKVIKSKNTKGSPFLVEFEKEVLIARKLLIIDDLYNSNKELEKSLDLKITFISKKELEQKLKVKKERRNLKRLVKENLVVSKQTNALYLLQKLSNILSVAYKAPILVKDCSDLKELKKQTNKSFYRAYPKLLVGKIGRSDQSLENLKKILKTVIQKVEEKGNTVNTLRLKTTQSPTYKIDLNFS